MCTDVYGVPCPQINNSKLCKLRQISNRKFKAIIELYLGWKTVCACYTRIVYIKYIWIWDMNMNMNLNMNMRYCGKFRNHHREPLFGHGNTFDSGWPVGGTHSPGGKGGGGSIFWMTQDIGLASYSYNLSTGYIDLITKERSCFGGDSECPQNVFPKNLNFSISGMPVFFSIWFYIPSLINFYSPSLIIPLLLSFTFFFVFLFPYSFFPLSSKISHPPSPPPSACWIPQTTSGSPVPDTKLIMAQILVSTPFCSLCWWYTLLKIWIRIF